MDPELLATSNYDLQSVKVCQSSLYVEAQLPGTVPRNPKPVNRVFLGPKYENPNPDV